METPPPGARVGNQALVRSLTGGFMPFTECSPTNITDRGSTRTRALNHGPWLVIRDFVEGKNCNDKNKRSE